MPGSMKHLKNGASHLPRPFFQGQLKFKLRNLHPEHLEKSRPHFFVEGYLFLVHSDHNVFIRKIDRSLEVIGMAMGIDDVAYIVGVESVVFHLLEPDIKVILEAWIKKNIKRLAEIKHIRVVYKISLPYIGVDTVNDLH